MSDAIEQAQEILRQRYASLVALYAAIDRDAGKVETWLAIEAHATQAGELMERLEKGETQVSLSDVLEQLDLAEKLLASMRTDTLH